MKSKAKKIIVLLFIVLICPLIINIHISNSINYIPKVDNPKISGTFNGIWIDDTFTNNGTSWGNWTWARTQPWCTKGNGTEENPYRIEDSIFLSAAASDCLLIENSRKYFVVENCTLKDIPVASFAGLKLNDVTNGNIKDNQVYNNYFGINCLNVKNTQLINNDCYDNTVCGIYLITSDYNTISGNNVSFNYMGIFFSNGDYNNITGNTVNNNHRKGIDLSQYSDYNNISGNTVNYNIEDGIYFNTQCNFNIITGNTANDNGDYGISIMNFCYNNIIDNNIAGNQGTTNQNTGISIRGHCYNHKITENTVNNNIENGIYVLGSECINFTIADNTVNNNALYGIWLSNGCDDNTIYENFFLKNGKHAFDNGTNNNWNGTTIGNYWDNWTTPDSSPPDGIVDDPYTYIGGSAGSIDYLPIADDIPPLVIINSPDDDDVFENSAPAYDVTITDDYLDEMWYTLDGGLHNYTFTGITGNIQQSAWDVLSDGTITLTFYASDFGGIIGFADVNIEKDATGPVIIITSPSPGTEFGASAPAFIITITDANLDSVWYSLDNGLTTYAITTNGTINQAAWTALSEGLIIITFYANDTLGHLSFEEVTITKEIPAGGIDPTTIIIIVVVSIVGGVAVIAGIYIFLKKRGVNR